MAPESRYSFAGGEVRGAAEKDQDQDDRAVGQLNAGVQSWDELNPRLPTWQRHEKERKQWSAGSVEEPVQK